MKIVSIVFKNNLCVHIIVYIYIYIYITWDRLAGKCAVTLLSHFYFNISCVPLVHYWNLLYTVEVVNVICYRVSLCSLSVFTCGRSSTCVSSQSDLRPYALAVEIL